MARSLGSPFVVRHVTDALIRILREALPSLSGPNDIEAAPLETISGSSGPAQRVILYLYRVAESPHLKNQGPEYEEEERSGGETVTRRRLDPLTLDLHYLLVPFSSRDRHLETYELLGLSAAAFHERGIFTLGEFDIAGMTEEERGLEFRLTKEPLTIEELAHIWEAVHEPYRLSISYCVRTVQIRTDPGSITRRVYERRLEMEQIDNG